MFDAKKVKNEIVEWIRNWFEENGKDCNAVVGISGGVDSSVVTALCVAALGKDRVFGIKMPCGEQSDIKYANMLIKHLEIKSYTMNIREAVTGINNQFPDDIKISDQTTINLPARIRMATLYAISQSLNGRVVNTCNMSESYVGFDTRYGDSAGDLSPLAFLAGKNSFFREYFIWRMAATRISKSLYLLQYRNFRHRNLYRRRRCSCIHHHKHQHLIRHKNPCL